MKKLYLLLLVCFIATAATAQFSVDPLYEKRYQALSVDKNLFWLDSTNGDLWLFDHANMRWAFIGSPRGASTSRKGTYLLKSLVPGELLILNTDSGEAWWTDTKTWVIIDDPSTRKTKK